MGNRPDCCECSGADSCALAGAAAFFAGIEDAGIVINGQLWCYFYAERRVVRQYAAASGRMVCSHIDGTAIVYGTEAALTAALEQIKTMMNPAVTAIINSCAVGLIGDDTAGIAAQAGMECPVVCVDGNGLKGSFSAGYRAAASAYFRQLPLAAQPIPVQPTINLLGCTVGYYNAPADLVEVRRLLALTGIDVQAAPGGGGSVGQVADLRRAQCNVVLHRELGLELAKLLQAQYGMPYISVLPPYGIEGTVDWLQAIAGQLTVQPDGWPHLQQEADCLRRHLHETLLSVQRLWGSLWFDRIVAAGPLSTAVAIGQVVRCELADAKRLTVVSSDGWDCAQLPEAIDDIIAVADSRAVEAELLALRGGLLLGSSNEAAWLHRQSVASVARLNIALPVLDEVVLRERPLAGLRGMHGLTERLWNGFINLKTYSI